LTNTTAWDKTLTYPRRQHDKSQLNNNKLKAIKQVRKSLNKVNLYTLDPTNKTYANTIYSHCS